MVPGTPPYLSINEPLSSPNLAKNVSRIESMATGHCGRNPTSHLQGKTSSLQDSEGAAYFSFQLERPILKTEDERSAVHSGTAPGAELAA
jgi:hypothetical protein